MTGYKDCKLCPRGCGIDRTQHIGPCGGGSLPRLARAALHYWEEPCISGEGKDAPGSGTVFFSGCTLRCCFCQNYEISAQNLGREVSEERLGEIFLQLQSQGAANLNLVTGTQYIPSILRALEITGDQLRIPVVWNCGGRLSLGMRKYYFAKERVESVGRRESIPITFVTGCALYFDTKILLEDGGLFTERFFFGEEDFNFCLRMKKERRAMACVPRSKIYHKVSASTANKSNAGKIYIHYLNRFIDMRQNSSAAFYAAWAMANFVYVSLLLGKRKDIGFGKGIRLMRDVLRDSLHKDSVTHADFTQALSRKG